VLPSWLSWDDLREIEGVGAWDAEARASIFAPRYCQFTCFTGTKVANVSVYLFYLYKRTNTDAEGAASLNQRGRHDMTLRAALLVLLVQKDEY
jgi:hypothetical protein